MTKILAFLTGVLSLLMPLSNAQALALSEARLNSSLNQTLDATIELRSATAAELDSLNIYVSRIESEISIRGIWPEVKVELVRLEKGNSYLKITSKDNVREPVLNFLLELTWSTGRIQREYTLLLNPAR